MSPSLRIQSMITNYMDGTLLANHKRSTVLFAVILIFTGMYFYLYTVSENYSPRIINPLKENKVLMHGRHISLGDKDTNITLSLEDIQTVQKIADLLKEAKAAKNLVNDSIFNSYAINRKDGNIVSKEPNSLLTLFTTCLYSFQLESLHNNTFRNWASFVPVVTPVLFTNDTKLRAIASQYGWMTTPVSKSKGNYPVLKTMYADVLKISESKYYGYVNADILFNDGLIKTMVSLMYDKSLNISDETPIMITGQRWNVLNVTRDDVTSRGNIDVIRKERGSLFDTFAQDYFITNKVYPWQELPDLVVGCPGVDNFLVIHGRSKKHVMLDTTETIPIVHQSSNPNPFLSHSHNMSNYNIELLQSIYKSVMPWPQGHTECIYRYTVDDSDKIVVKERISPEHCTIL